MNPAFSVREVNQILNMLVDDNLAEYVRSRQQSASDLLAVLAADKDYRHQYPVSVMVEVFLHVMARLDDDRFMANVNFWSGVAKARSCIMVSNDSEVVNFDILRRQAELWKGSYKIKADDALYTATSVPPPLFEPHRDAQAGKDTMVTDNILAMKTAMDERIEQRSSAVEMLPRFILGLKEDHPYLNIFVEFSGLHRHQKTMILMVNIFSSFFTQALLFDSGTTSTSSGALFFIPL